MPFCVTSWAGRTWTGRQRLAHLWHVAREVCNSRGAFCRLRLARSVGYVDTFVPTEVHKQATWSDRSVDLSYFRDRDGAEVDLIIEDRHSGDLAGLEIKLTSTPTTRHARHLLMLLNELGDRFKAGVVIHAGSQVLSLGDRIWAVPVSALWRADPDR